MPPHISKRRFEFYKIKKELARLIELKSKFDKLISYTQKLKFWDENFWDEKGFHSFKYLYYLTDDETLQWEEENFISIYPEKDEEHFLFNKWLLNNIQIEKETEHSYNIEKMKEKYFSTVLGNDFALEFTQQEIENIEKRKSSGEEDFYDGIGYVEIEQGDYNMGFQSIIQKYDICSQYEADGFLPNCLAYAKGIADAYYLKFLKEKLEQLKKGKKISPQKHESINYSHRQIAIAYCITGEQITPQNALKILSSYSETKSVGKFLTKRIFKKSDLTKLSENKTSDSKHLKNLREAKRLISGRKNKQAVIEIARIITEFESAYNSFY